MMLILCFVMNLSMGLQEVSLQEVRQLYKEAETSEEATETLLGQLEEADEAEPVLLAYRASGTMLMAKHVSNPFSKMGYFKKGKNMMQQAVDAAPGNAEIRFLRFALQSSTPAFLGYKDNMEEDKAFLLRELPKLKNKELEQLILPFLINSDYLTEKEKQLLRPAGK